MKWAAQENLYSHQDAHDEGVDIVYWAENMGSATNHWIYVTGWVTEMDGSSVKGTRFATYKYDATFFDSGAPPLPEAVAYFPPYDPGEPGHVGIQTGDTYKAVAMVFDEINETLYIAGEGARSPGAADQDYKVIGYDKNLVPLWDNSYNGPISGDDVPVDIALDECGQQVVVVTGTSPGNGTGLDIATVAFLTSDGSKATTLWPSDGARRYNNVLEDGDDRAAQVGGVCVVVSENQAILTATVLGTSWGGATKDDYTLHRWSGTATSPNWEYRYDTSENDVAVSMAEAGLIYLTGHSEVPSSSDIDIATIGYLVGWGELWVERWDYGVGEADYPLDMHVATAGCHPTFGCRYHIWITGASFDGAYTDATTIMYGDGWGGLSLDFEEGWGDSSAFEYGKAVTTYDGEPYITGSQGGSTSDRMLALSYYEDPPDYLHNWDRIFSGPYIGATSNEGRGIAVADVDGERSIFVVGVSTESGEGRQFTTWRYRED